jgi:hypothetical protein
MALSVDEEAMVGMVDDYRRSYGMEGVKGSGRFATNNPVVILKPQAASKSLEKAKLSTRQRVRR